MTLENQETLRFVNETAVDSEELLQYLHPEELYPGIRAPDQHQRYVGRDGWTEFIEGAVGAWESVTIEPTRGSRPQATGFSRSTDGSFEAGTASRSTASFQLSSPFGMAWPGSTVSQTRPLLSKRRGWIPEPQDHPNGGSPRGLVARSRTRPANGMAGERHTCRSSKGHA
jgi:hypothetical protein